MPEFPIEWLDDWFKKYNTLISYQIFRGWKPTDPLTRNSAPNMGCTNHFANGKNAVFMALDLSHEISSRERPLNIIKQNIIKHHWTSLTSSDH